MNVFLVSSSVLEQMKKKNSFGVEPFLGYCPNNIVGIVLQGCNCIAIGGWMKAGRLYCER